MINKNLIKIIKRDKDNAEKTQVSAETLKTEREINQGLAHTVNNWIDERRDNRRTEKLLSVDKIAAWQLLPETF